MAEQSIPATLATTCPACGHIGFAPTHVERNGEITKGRRVGEYHGVASCPACGHDAEAILRWRAA